MFTHPRRTRVTSGVTGRVAAPRRARDLNVDDAVEERCCRRCLWRRLLGSGASCIVGEDDGRKNWREREKSGCRGGEGGIKNYTTCPAYQLSSRWFIWNNRRGERWGGPSGKLLMAGIFGIYYGSRASPNNDRSVPVFASCPIDSRSRHYLN